MILSNARTFLMPQNGNAPEFAVMPQGGLTAMPTANQGTAAAHGNAEAPARRARTAPRPAARGQAGEPPRPPRPRRQRDSAAAWLGAELRRARIERGISQRKLTQLIGLSAHSNLGEYERGSRIPPADIVVACERLLALPAGQLQRLQQLALRERARGARSLPARAAGIGA